MTTYGVEISTKIEAGRGELERGLDDIKFLRQLMENFICKFGPLISEKYLGHCPAINDIFTQSSLNFLAVEFSSSKF